MDGKELYNLYEAYLDVYEGKVPWNDPKYPLQSGWTPAEKNREKRERTGVEDPNTPQHNISDKDMSRYGSMKNVDDTETEKAPKGKKTLFGKKSPEHKNLHQFKKFPIKSNKGEEQTIGNIRRSRGTPKPGATDDKSNMYQSPIKRGDKRTRGGKLDQWKGINPRNEEIDIYDTILSHLLDEGYVETLEAAEVIMVNMSEEWRDDIIESIGTGPFGPDDKEDPRYDPEKLIKHYWNSRIFRSKRPDELPTRSKEDRKKQKQILRKMRIDRK